MDILLEALAICGAILLLIAPGLLVTLALPKNSLSARILIPTAFILSPAVVALELAAAAHFGIPFSAFVPAAAAFNSIGAAALYILGRHQISPIPISWLAIAMLIALPFTLIILDLPLRREYGWHNMMQLAAIQSIYQLPTAPEELSLAGTRLNYGWLGWAQLAAMAKLLDRAPTLLFIPVNIAHFVALFVVLCEASAAFLSRTQRASLLAIAVGAIIISPGMGGMTLYLPELINARLQSEARVVPILGKYPNMDLMVLGLSCVSLAVYAAIRAAQSRNIGAALLVPIAGLATGLIYPLLAPPCVVLGAVWLLAIFLSPNCAHWGIATYSRSETAVLGLAWALSLATIAAYLAFMGQDSTKSVIQLRELRAIPSKVIVLICTLAVPNALMLLVLVKAWRERSGVLVLLVLSSIAMQVMYLAFRLPAYVEYKFLFAALITSAPAVVAAVLLWSARGRLRQASLAGAFTCLLAAMLVITPKLHQPVLARGNALDEHRAAIQSKDASLSWLRAVQQHTPADAVLLSGPTDQPIAVFAGRAIYVCADIAKTPDGQRRLRRAGYLISCFDELHEVKGYSVQEIARRSRILENVLEKHIDTALAVETFDALRLLGRPLVIHMGEPSGFLTWLTGQGIGRQIFASPTDTVWFISRIDLANIP